MNDIFTQRSAHTEQIIAKLKRSLQSELGAEHDALIGDHTCVYATGSCGRGEMGKGSDLDAYVVRVDGPVMDSQRIQEAVEAANQTAGLPPLDNDGGYLEMVPGSQLIGLLGAPEDDTQEAGLLTKRMLLLLESRVLLGAPAHEKLVGQVIDAYWRNEDLHPTDYLPYVLVNDIVRYWRIVLLNHEWKLRDKKRKIEGDPNVAVEDREAVLLAARRYKSYKLRLPRCLTCFSALTYLLALTPRESGHVSKEQLREMITLSPVDRLRRLPELVNRDLELVNQLLTVYRSYLERTNVPKHTLPELLQHDKKVQRELTSEGREFTRLMFELVQELGGGRPLHRTMLV